MRLSLTIAYPWWFITFCILTGAAYAFVLYYREKKLAAVNKWVKIFLISLRFITVSLLSFLLLSPFIKTVIREVEKPIIIIAQDNSESVMVGKTAGFNKNEYKQEVHKLMVGFAAKYDTVFYSFGDRIGNDNTFSFNEKQTDISSFFEEMETRYSNRNVGAVIIASDGIYNKGANPVFTSGKLAYPVYTIALGDTVVKKDIILNKVSYNRYAYLGNTFPLEIVMDAKQCKDKTTTLTISKEGKSIYSQPIAIRSSDFITTIPIQLEAKEVGLQRYKVSLSTIEGELSITNNTQDVFIEVLDGRQKIALLAAAPHPDVAALKTAIETNSNYEVDVQLAGNFRKNLSAYNLVILHQLPAAVNGSAQIINELTASNVPLLYIVGAATQLPAFNALNTGVSISQSRQMLNETQAVLATDFTLFTLSDNVRNYVSKLPPLQAPYGNYITSNAANTLLYQRIGVVDTKSPLFLFNDNAGGSRKQAVIVGEGLWKWKLYDFAEHNNNNVFNELVSKTVQFLSIKVDKSLFRVKSKNNFYENENIEFEAELYNPSYELINDPEVNITITNSENKKFPFTFTKTANAYRLNTGMLPVGEYKYQAQTKNGDKIYTAKGEFSVTPLQLESINTRADHQLLYALAKKHGGAMVYPGQLDKLGALINTREDVKPVSYSQKRLNDLINLKAIFFLLLFLLTAEWLIRKRSGGY